MINETSLINLHCAVMKTTIGDRPLFEIDLAMEWVVMNARYQNYRLHIA
jgi:hypothetical protein